MSFVCQYGYFTHSETMHMRPAHMAVSCLIQLRVRRNRIAHDHEVELLLAVHLVGHAHEHTAASELDDVWLCFV